METTKSVLKKQNKPTSQQLLTALDEIISALAAGCVPQISDAILQAFTCFDPAVLADDPDINPEDLILILNALTIDDLATFKRARTAVENHEQAWLGFKVVTDPAVACDSSDTAVMGIIGEGQGSADALPGVFFAAVDRQIVFGRQYSVRDRKQMLDITRGPHMHNRQYAGLAWTSLDLEPTSRVIMLGAGDVSAQLEITARLVGFETLVIDYDESYLSEIRFPHSERVLIPSFDEMPDLGITFDDYLCVLTRGHMYDPEALIYALQTPAGYIGMMGCASKNECVFSLAAQRGIDPAAFEDSRLHAPIGFKGVGGKTPPELAINITSQLIQIRNDRRKKP